MKGRPVSKKDLANISNSDFKSINNAIEELKIKYSNVGKADKCDDLWSGCSEILSQLNDKSQVIGARAVVLCSTSPQSSSCRNLGYPKNPRPF